MYYVNQNTDIVQPTHRLELWERVIGAGVRFWYYATLVRLFAGSFRNKFSFTCYLWMCSIYNALSNAGLNLYRSVKVGGEFSRYLTKINRIFKLTKTSPEEVCIICMSELLNCRKLVQCGHLFHTKCLFLWLQNKSECPTCRTVIRLD